MYCTQERPARSDHHAPPVSERLLCSRYWALFWESCTATTLIWPTGNSVATAKTTVKSSIGCNKPRSLRWSGRRLTLTGCLAFSIQCLVQNELFCTPSPVCFIWSLDMSHHARKKSITFTPDKLSIFQRLNLFCHLKYRVFHFKRKPNYSCTCKLWWPVGTVVLFGTSLSGYALLNASRTAANYFDAK
jgi:hypothetical protein